VNIKSLLKGMNCTKLFKSKKVQKQLKKEWEKTMKQIIETQGGLPENAWKIFNQSARKSFIKTCKKRSKGIL